MRIIFYRGVGIRPLPTRIAGSALQRSWLNDGENGHDDQDRNQDKADNFPEGQIENHLFFSCVLYALPLGIAEVNCPWARRTAVDENRQAAVFRDHMRPIFNSDARHGLLLTMAFSLSQGHRADQNHIVAEGGWHDG